MNDGMFCAIGYLLIAAYVAVGVLLIHAEERDGRRAWRVAPLFQVSAALYYGVVFARWALGRYESRG